MAQTGLQLRRDTKANILLTAVRVGEIVYATDTEEIGMFLNGAMSWTKVGPVESVPSGGTTGQALIKQSDTDGDATWGDVTSKIDMYWTDHSNFFIDDVLVDCSGITGDERRLIEIKFSIEGFNSKEGEPITAAFTFHFFCSAANVVTDKLQDLQRNDEMYFYPECSLKSFDGGSTVRLKGKMDTGGGYGYDNMSISIEDKGIKVLDKASAYSPA